MQASDLGIAIARNSQDGLEYVCVGNVFVGPPVRRFPDAGIIQHWLDASIDDLFEITEQLIADRGDLDATD